MLLNEALVKEGIATVTKVTKKSYSWGTLRTIEAGSSFSIVLHPDGWKKVLIAIHGGSAAYKDETGNQWVIQSSDSGDGYEDDLVFRGINGNRKKLKVPAKFIKKLH